MKLASPLPQPLPKECIKAAKIFKSFVDSGNNGLDGVIPRQILEQAKGFAIFTVIKAGFLFSARAGSGVVIAKLEDGSWSAPSAIGSAGLGVGGQAGAEMTDFLVVLNSRSAVRSFMAAGSLTLGGNMSVALGPLGRNGEALGSLNTSGKMAAMYSYSKTRGLFGGVSVEGSVIVERQDANAQAYNSDVSAKQLLSGSIDPPEWAMPLVKTLEACVGMPGGHKWVDDSAQRSPGGSDYAFGGVASPGNELPPSLRKKKNGSSSPFPPPSWGKEKSGGSYFTTDAEEREVDSPLASRDNRLRSQAEGPLVDLDNSTYGFQTKFESDFATSSNGASSQPGSRGPLHKPQFSTGSPFGDSSTPKQLAHNRHASAASYFTPANGLGSSLMSPRSTTNPFSKPPGPKADDPFAYETSGESIDDYDLDRTRSQSLSKNRPQAEDLFTLGGVAKAVALYNFNAIESGDLGFSKGDVIVVTKKSNSTDDWWTGKLNGKEGIFPANFVEVV